MDPQPTPGQPVQGQPGPDQPGRDHQLGRDQRDHQLGRDQFVRERPARAGAGARWRAIQPPPAGPISAGRAYAEVLGVYAAFFGVSIILGGEILARRYPAPQGSWAIFVPEAVRALSFAGLAALVAILLSGRRGITARSLGICWPRNADGTASAMAGVRMAAWATVALLAGGGVTAALAHGDRLVQPVRQDFSYLIYTVASSLNAGVAEELIALAFVVTTLRQARRPLPEIVIVAVVLRCAYHDYYGLGVIGIAVWASIFVWLFLRTGSVLPLIAVHVLWDASIFLAQRWHLVLVVQGGLIVLLLAAALMSWLAARARLRSLNPTP